MMTHKIVIANWGMSNEGKSTSIRYAFEVLQARYNYTVLLPATGIYDPAQDVKAIIEIPQPNGHIVKVGIESQGDPGTKACPARITQSIKDFIASNCEIMLVACRTKGDTIGAVYYLRSLQWQIIWFDNSTMWVDSKNNRTDASGSRLAQQDKQLQEQLSRDYGFYVASLIERLVLTGGII